MIPRFLVSLAILGFAATLDADQPAAQKSPREALQVFGDLIGTWTGTGTPVGTLEEKQKNFWSEKMDWGWKFKDKDAWIVVSFEKSKNFTAGELRYVPDKDHFTLTLTNLQKEKLVYVGTVETREKTKILTVDREAGKDLHRMVFTFLHSNRFLYRYEVKPDGRPLYAKKWSVGATKEGEAFAVGTGKPECIVSGGTGTSAVSYLGKTYYVCCSGCRDEFNATPAKYVKEYEEKLAKAKKK
ncbi:MAG: YHS domain-containing protein [Gemmataceae bacterium]|nr:YHS domain-containing protein [Gemmataceae bacterium]